jgi:hypothetical protein
MAVETNVDATTRVGKYSRSGLLVPFSAYECVVEPAEKNGAEARMKALLPRRHPEETCCTAAETAYLKISTNTSLSSVFGTPLA